MLANLPLERRDEAVEPLLCGKAIGLRATAWEAA
jgi:hypothetical protein